MVCNFTADLADSKWSAWIEEITATLVRYGVEDMSAYFLLRRKYWSRDSHTWSIRCGDRVVCSWIDFLLGTDCRLYQNMLVWYAQHNSDNYLVLGCLQGALVQEHAHYLGSKHNLPLEPPRTACSLNSAGRHPKPHRGNASARHGSRQRLGASLMIVLRRNRTGCIYLCRTLDSESR